MVCVETLLYRGQSQLLLTITEVSIILISLREPGWREGWRGRRQVETTCNTCLPSVQPWSWVSLDRPPLSSRALGDRQGAPSGPEMKYFYLTNTEITQAGAHFFRLEHKFSYSSKHFLHVDVVLRRGLK